jgi:CubicO group peptidase (beta-lactamase class C family)
VCCYPGRWAHGWGRGYEGLLHADPMTSAMIQPFELGSVTMLMTTTTTMMMMMILTDEAE